MKNGKICSTINYALITVLLLTVCASAAERRTVKVNMANIRSGPGTGYNILWKIEKNHPINVIKTSGKWCRFVDFEGDKGWIYKPLTAKIPSVIVKKEGCNIRSGPGTDYDILFKVERGVPFRVIKQKGKWINIQHADGDAGWIYGSLVW